LSDRVSKLLSFYRGILDCSKCPLSKSRKQVVPGEGGYRLPIILLGEAPGKTEDEVGRPFVGRAGKLLDRALLRAGLTRLDVFITNSVKCRPPSNRKPYKSEIEACSPYLREEVLSLEPEVIVTLGGTGLQALSLLGELEVDGSRISYESVRVGSLRGRDAVLRLSGKSVAVVPTYHPAACIRNPHLVKELERDLQKAASRLAKEQ